MKVRGPLFLGFISLLFVSASPLFADEMTAGDQLSFCKDKNFQPSQTACRYFILGVVQGVGIGDSAIMTNGQFVERSPTHFCIPQPISNAQMVEIFVTFMTAISQKYPEDLKFSAAMEVDAVMHTKFPCNR